MTYSARFEDALLYAARLHRDQVRKSTGVPYMGHLLGVTGTVIDAGGTEDEAIAAVLHDAIEDQGGDPVRKDILKIFGEEVERIVSACSDTDVMPKPPWKERKIEHIRHMKKADNSVRLVVIADKLHNLGELRREYAKASRLYLRDYTVPQKYERGKFLQDIWVPFKGGRNGTVWYYFCMALALMRDNEKPSPIKDLSERLHSEAMEFWSSVRVMEPDLVVDSPP